jgi:hypothetical protein
MARIAGVIDVPCRSHHERHLHARQCRSGREALVDGRSMA